MEIVDKYLKWIFSLGKRRLQYAEGATEEQLKQLLEVYPDTPKSLITILSKIDGTYYRKYPREEICVGILSSDVMPHYLGSIEKILVNIDNQESIDDIYGEYSMEEYCEADEWYGPPAKKGVDPAASFSKRLWFSDCTNNGGSAQLFVDFAPSKDGVYGQIVRYAHDPDNYAVIANSFDEYLEKVMNEWRDTVIGEFLNDDTTIDDFTFALRGKLSKPIRHFEYFIKSKGGRVSKTLSRNVDLCIIGKDITPEQMQEIEDKNIYPLTEKMFFEVFSFEVKEIQAPSPVVRMPKTKLNPNDAEALKALASKIKGKNKTWSSKFDYAKWEDIILEEINSETRVTSLFFFDGSKGEIASELGNLDALEKLTIDLEFKIHLPKEITKLRNLKSIEINLSSLYELPDIFEYFPKLENLFLHTGPSLEYELPSSIGKLEKLKVLRLQNLKLQKLPEFIFQLKELENIDLSNNELIEVPKEIDVLSKLKHLLLHSNNLEHLPESLSNLKHLETLILAANKLKSVPDMNKSAKSLKTILLNNNHLTNFPKWISKTNPVALRVDENYITGNIPNFIGDLTNLEILCLYSNYFTGGLPERMRNLSNLITLYFFDNIFEETPPVWFDKMPCLKFNQKASDTLREMARAKGVLRNP